MNLLEQGIAQHLLSAANNIVWNLHPQSYVASPVIMQQGVWSGMSLQFVRYIPGAKLPCCSKAVGLIRSYVLQGGRVPVQLRPREYVARTDRLNSQ